MRILIVEDFDYRQDLIKEKIEFENIDCTKNADKGLELLEANKYDIVFLDHDLIDTKSGSYLTENWFNNKDKFQTTKPIVIIHSMNMEGATKMENYLKGVSKITERIPFKLIVTEKVNIKEIVLELIKKNS